MAKKVKRTELAWGIWSNYSQYFLNRTYHTRAEARKDQRANYGPNFRVIRVRITEVR